MCLAAFTVFRVHPCGSYGISLGQKNHNFLFPLKEGDGIYGSKREFCFCIGAKLIMLICFVDADLEKNVSPAVLLQILH